MIEMSSRRKYRHRHVTPAQAEQMIETLKDYVSTEAKNASLNRCVFQLINNILAAPLVVPANGFVWFSSRRSNLHRLDIAEGIIRCNNLEHPEQDRNINKALRNTAVAGCLVELSALKFVDGNGQPVVMQSLVPPGSAIPTTLEELDRALYEKLIEVVYSTVRYLIREGKLSKDPVVLITILGNVIRTYKRHHLI